MKNILLPLLAGVSVSLATSLYYTFDGSVSYSTTPQLTVGSPLHFVILADREQVTTSSGGYGYFNATLVQGEIINGTGPLSTDHSGWNVGDNFYVEQRAYVYGIGTCLHRRDPPRQVQATYRIALIVSESRLPHDRPAHSKREPA